MINITLTNSIEIPLSDVPRMLWKIFDEEFVYANPKFHKMQRLGFWTGNEPRELRCYQVIGQENNCPMVSFPRGALGRVIDCISGETYRVVDKTVVSEKVNYNYVSPFALRPDQINAVTSLATAGGGILEGECGAGKTEVGIKLIDVIGQKTLIVCHKIELVQQWQDRIAKHFPDITVGLVGGGKKMTIGKEITIATVQTLMKHMEIVKDGGFGCLVLDECHHASAPTFNNVVHYSPAKYRFGLTATTERRDGLGFLFYDEFGSRIKNKPEIVAQIKNPYHKWVEENNLNDTTIKIVRTPFEFVSSMDNKSFYKIMIDKMISDVVRNGLILNDIINEVKTGHKCLVLTDRLEHCALIHKVLSCPLIQATQKFSCNPVVFRGNMKIDKIKKLKEDVASGVYDVVIGTSVADEGMDIPLLDRAFICLPGAKNKARFKQRVGRIERMFSGKKDAIAYYYWDARVIVRDENGSGIYIFAFDPNIIKRQFRNVKYVN